ncbi:hypothetical protein MED217_13611 [Leeuwenhoekiella blandensis MED217]|uniref:Uncharacterized protein n=2 Tax=Flavobacteriaceae TaxID=49546 RepID=A3XR93_LEEBM|nr:hypothetical protein MED217_13611 [Leeuwenhoekiella blandensis MED217]
MLAATLPSLHRDKVFEAVVLAGLGACVSFVVSLVLKWLLKRLKAWILKRRDLN